MWQDEIHEFVEFALQERYELVRAKLRADSAWKNTSKQRTLSELEHTGIGKWLERNARIGIGSRESQLIFSATRFSYRKRPSAFSLLQNSRLAGQFSFLRRS